MNLLIILKIEFAGDCIKRRLGHSLHAEIIDSIFYIGRSYMFGKGDFKASYFFAAKAMMAVII